MKFIIVAVYTVHEKRLHPHYPQGFPQVLGVKPPVRRGFPRLFSPSAGELLYIFHRPKFFFVISIRKSVCFRQICDGDWHIFVNIVDFYLFFHNSESLECGKYIAKSAVYFTNVLHFQVFGLYISFGRTVPDSVLPTKALQRQKMPPRMPYANMRSDGRAFKSSAAVSPRIRR